MTNDRHPESAADSLPPQLERSGILAAIARGTTNSIVVADAARRIIWANAHYVAARGVPADTLIGRPLAVELTGDVHDSGEARAMDESLDESGSFTGVIHGVGPPDNPTTLEVDISRLPDDGGDGGFIAIGTDLTEVFHQRMDAEAALADVNAFRAATDQHCLVSIADRRGRIIDANTAFCRVSGYALDELLGQDHRLLNSGVHPRAFWVDMWKTVASGEVWRAEVCNKAKDGSVYWVDSTIVPHMGPDGTPEKYVSIRVDITARKSAERDAAAYRAATDEHSLVSIADARGRIIDANPAFCRVSGYTREELLGQDHRLLNSGQHPRAFWVDMWRDIASGKAWRGEVCNRAKDGRLYWVDSTIVPHLGPDGCPERYISIRVDITDRKLAQSNADRMHGRLDAHLAALDQSWCRIEYSPAGTIQSVNRKFLDLVGYRREDLIGHPHRILVAAEFFNEDGDATFWDGLRDGEIRSGEFLRRSHLGKDVWLNSTYSPVRASDGSVEKVVEYAVDITAQKEMETAVREAMAQTEQANAAKSDFLANMSHEIRTPMTAILGYAEILETDEEIEADPAQTRAAFEAIRANADHLLSIINDILDVSKIEAGKMEVESIDSNPARIAEEVASLTGPRAHGKGIELRIEYATPIPERISSDPTRLKQIILNLTGNAIKFTETGSVTIRVSCRPDVELMEFAVVDTGVGMTPEQVESISQFTAFNQADTSTTREFGGTGLGLRISNALAQMLGGAIRIESEQGSGSTFIATIDTGSLAGRVMIEPERMPSLDQMRKADEKASRQPVLSNDALEGVRILVAEDGPDNRRLIAFHLGKAGADVELVENGRLAVDYMQAATDETMPDVILMDMQMPELDGYGATAELRTLGFNLPILALTAHAMESDRQRCIDAGCDDHLTKPIDRIGLVEACRDWTRFWRDQADRAAA